MKNLKKILIGLTVVLIVSAVIKDQIIKAVISNVGSSVVGAPVKIGHFNLGILTQKVRIKDLKVYNPPGFPDEPLVDIPEIAVDCDLFSLLKGKLHLPLVILNMKEMTVIKNKEGKLNIDSLKVVTQPKAAGKEHEKPPQLAIQLDYLKLTVGQVIVKDFSKGEPPAIQAYDVGLKDKEFKNINSVEQLAALVLVQGLGPTAIKSAGIYAAAAILGVGFLPAGVLGVIVGKDDSVGIYRASLDAVHAAVLQTIREMGKLNSENKSNGQIKANLDGADITVYIEKDPKGTKVRATARKYFLPKPEIAAGFIHELGKKVK